MSQLLGLFITGTDTGVGKTYVAAGVIRALRRRGLRVGAYKPAVSGSRAEPQAPVWDDLDTLQAALGQEVPIERISPQRFAAPCAPPVAAWLEGRQVDAALLRNGIDWWRGKAEVIIVEGAGGLLSPLSDSDLVADVASDLGFPLVIVARLSLGTINQTLMTVEVARTRGLPIAGIVLNRPAALDPHDRSAETNPRELAARCDVPILAILPYEPDAALLQISPLFTIDWMELAYRR